MELNPDSYLTCLAAMELERHFKWNSKECLCYVKLIPVSNPVILLKIISILLNEMKWRMPNELLREMVGIKEP